MSSIPSIEMKKSPRVALVTGSNKGIGKEIVRRLYNEGNTVTIIACRDKALGEAACEEIKKSSDGTPSGAESEDRLLVCPFDLTDEETITATAKFVKERYGKLDILINNAAICFNDPTLYGKVPFTPFEGQASITIQTNFFGTLRLTQAVLPLLQQSDESPRIINIASAAGRLSILKSKDMMDTVTSPTLTLETLEQLMTDFVSTVENGTHKEKGFPNTCYGMSKLGIIAMTKVLAKKYPNIMSNSVDPGYCATDQNNNQGFVSAERGSFTPFLLATLSRDQINRSGGHFFEEQEIIW